MNIKIRLLREMIKRMNKKPELEMIMGIVASGKSTYRREQDEIEYVSLDEIRKDVFKVRFDPRYESLVLLIAQIEIDIILSQKKNCLIDATNIDEERRKGFIKIANRYNAIKKAIIIDTPSHICLERNSRRPEETRVPEDIVLGMIEKWKIFFSNYREILIKEDFDEILVFTTRDDNKRFISQKIPIQS